MPFTAAGVNMSDQDLNTRKWGNSGTGLGRINDKGHIEVYDEQGGSGPRDMTPAPAPAPAVPAPAAAPAPTAPSPINSLQQATDAGAGWNMSSGPSVSSLGGAAASSNGGGNPYVSQLLQGRLY